MDQQQISTAITAISDITNHGMMNMLNFSEGAQNYMDKLIKNPSMETIIQSVLEIQNDESDDQDIKEIKALMQTILKEDLKIDSPFDLVTKGMKLMLGGADSIQKEYQEAFANIQNRLQEYYKKKMMPVMTEMLQEQS